MAHILTPSKYHETFYQSLNGTNYQLYPGKKQLIQKKYNEDLVYTITLKDTCFTSYGKSFNRIAIDSILDERFFSKKEFLLKHNCKSELPPESSLNSIERFFIFNF